MPNEMSPVERVRHAFTTWGMKEMVVHAAAASPRVMVNVTCHTLRFETESWTIDPIGPKFLWRLLHNTANLLIRHMNQIRAASRIPRVILPENWYERLIRVLEDRSGDYGKTITDETLRLPYSHMFFDVGCERYSSFSHISSAAFPRIRARTCPSPPMPHALCARQSGDTFTARPPQRVQTNWRHRVIVGKGTSSASPSGGR